MKISKIAGIIAKARHYLDLKNLMELYNTTWFIQTWPTVTSKPGFHMITTMAVIAPFAEEKNESGIAAITWKPLSSDRSDRSDNDRWGRKSSISAIVVAAIATIAGMWFVCDRCNRWPFFLRDRSDHMETKLKWASKYPNRLRSVYTAQTKIVTLMRRKLMRVRKPLSSSRNGA